MRLVDLVLAVPPLLHFAPGVSERARADVVERVVLVDSPFAAGATGDGDLVIVVGSGRRLWAEASGRGAVGLVAMGDVPDIPAGDRLLVPAAGRDADPLDLWAALTARLRESRAAAGRNTSRRSGRREELARLLVSLLHNRIGPAELMTWVANQVAARVWLLAAGEALPDEVAMAGGRELVDALAAGGPALAERDTERGLHAVAVRVGARVPHPVLLVARSERWGGEDLALLGEVADGLGVVLWADEVEEEAQRLAAFSAVMRVSALQYLVACDLAQAGRVLEHFVPGLVSAGAGVVGIVEAAEGEDRAQLARLVERVLKADALTVECPLDEGQVIVAAAQEPEALANVLGPVIGAKEGRAGGLSRSTPWLRTGAAYQGAMAALARARGQTPAVGIDTGGPALEDLLGLDARIWAALVMQPLDDLSAIERAELVHLAAETLWWGPVEASRLVGRDRDTLTDRLDQLSKLTGLDHRDPWQRVSLHLAVRLSALPSPPVLDRKVTVKQALDHPGARQWAAEILASLDDGHRADLRAWAGAEGDRDRMAEALGISPTTAYRRLRAVAARTGRRLTRYPGPAEEMLLALHVAGEVSMGSIPRLGKRRLATGRGREPMDVSEINTEVPHVARVYDYLLGGRCNWPADRQVAERILELNPHTETAVRANRAFMQRSTRVLAQEEGVTQFLDLGSGIPTSPNLHEVAQSTVPQARVVYIDNDPIVLAHAGPLLRSTPQGATGYVEADVEDPAAVLKAEGVRALVDPSRPVAVSLNAVVHFMSDAVAHHVVGVLREALPRGSFLVITSMTHDFAPNLIGGVRRYYSGAVVPLVTRTRSQVLDLFGGAELIEPGLVSGPRWRPECGVPQRPDEETNLYTGVARLL